ncbi:MAG: OmpA family protein [Myxococcota bacterium]
MLTLLSLLTPFAAAQSTDGAVPAINAQNFRPSIDSTRTLWVDDASVQDRTYMGRLLFHYVANPLVYEYDDGERVELVSDVLQADLTAGVRVWKLRFGADLPLYLVQSGEAGQGVGLGDIGLDAKLGILDREKAALGLALSTRITLPTATVTNALGSPNTGWEIDAIVDRKLGKALLALNVGVRGGPKTELENVSLDDFLVARLAGGYALSDNAGMALELAGEKSLSAPFDNAAGLPLEWMATGYGYLTNALVVRGGVGTGLTSGIGSPDFRVAVGIGLEPRTKVEDGPKDKDKDGVLDPADTCPTKPEDMDSFEDADGCPDLDNDQDTVPDASDACINDPEDRDSVKDTDGCPEPEVAVKVRLIDAATSQAIGAGRVVVKGAGAESSGGAVEVFELLPGSYEAAGTAVNYQPATMAFEVKEGATVDVKLTPEAETKITVTRDRIDLREEVNFDLATADIQKRSYPLLEQVAKVMNTYPEILVLRVEGHTDSRGDDAYNLDLSQRRADAVKAWLVAKGVAADRLVAQGLGESKPLDPAETDAAWAKNRRVDVFIERWAEPVAPAAPAAPK